jgi:cellulose synthase/poly-beta-1,6-N-acetylglucosamine synthase-like glycosyltransferase
MVTDWPVWAAVLFVGAVFVELVRMNAMFLRALKWEMEMTDGQTPNEPENHPRVTVIVPAKDEEEHIEQSARSILASDYPFLEILLVDDRSGDSTQAIMEALAREDARVKVIRITELPSGWTGKTNAMFQAAARASGDILLFTDADAVMKPDTISRSVNFFLGRNLDVLSLLPGFTERGFIEDAVHIHMALGLSYFFPLPDVNDQANPAGLASGCYIMMKRRAYDDIGTWDRFRQEVTEDVALSKAVKARGMKLAVLRAGDMVRTRPFSRIHDVCLFWKRTFYGGLDKSIAKILRLCTNYVALAFLFALCVVSGGAWLNGGATGATTLLFVLAFVDVAAVVVPVAVFIRMEHGYWPYSLAAPVGAIIAAWVCLSTVTAIISDRGIKWRGSRYR